MIRGVTIVVLALLPAVAAAAPAPDGPRARAAAKKPTCMGKKATIVGTGRPDKGRRKIVGTKRADVIVARGGADDIRGRGGRDRICAGSGNDKVDGGGGDDLIDGGNGKDRLKGGVGNDRVLGGKGDDTIDGGRGTDACDGGKGANKVRRCEPPPMTGPQGPGGGPTGPTGPTQAAADTATTNEDASVAIPVLANDTGNGLTIKSVDAGTAKAALSVSGGQVVYDPRGRLDGLAAGASVSETFTYVVAAGSGATATGTVNVTVTGVDDAPLAVDDAATVDEGAATALDVLANDTDIDGGPRRIASVDAFGSSGTVTIAPDGGSVTYTPGVGVCGVTDSFKYTLETGATATVTVTIECAGAPPTAVDDSKVLAEDAPATAIDVLANDTDSDGGVKRITSAGDPAHGAVVVAGDGADLTYQPDADHCGADSFTYTLNGGSTATVSVTVTCVDDGPTAVADAKTVDEDAGAADVDVLANDTDIDGGPKSVESVGTASNGTATLTGGVVRYAPAANHCGPDSFTYTLNGGSTATVTVTVTCFNDPPVADADSYGGGIRGVRMRVGSTHADAHETEHTGSVLDGDTDVDTPVADLTVTPGAIATTDGGTVTMAGDGTFTYDPPAGDDGTDSFTYTVEDNDTGDADGTEATHTATVTLTRSGPRVWFVDDSAPAGGRGVSHAPLQSPAPLATGGVHDTKDGTGDRIFVYSGTYTTGIDLETNQKLLGQPHGLVVNTATLVASGTGTKPAIASGTASVVTLAPGTEVQDLALGTTAAGGYSLLAPAAAGAYTVADTDIDNQAAGALNLADGTPTVTLGNVSSNNSSGNGIRITDTDGGSVAIGSGGTLQNAANADVHVAGALGALTIGSSISDDAGQLVSVADKPSGTVTFSGAITDGNDGDGGGISLVNNDASTISFTGGLTLSTGANEAFAATQGGTVAVSGAANTIDATGGGLRIQDTTIGAGGLSFRSIRSVGGSAPGIHLHNTGSTGGLTVTGSGTPGSGGTISDKLGADGAATGNGVLLHTTRNVSLSRMQLDDLSNHAIRGTSVTNFTLVDSVINGANGTNANINEGAVHFDGLLGQAAIRRTTISGGVSDNLRVVNGGGILNRLVVEGGVIGLNSHTSGNDGIMVEALNDATLNTTVQDTTFQGARGDHFDLNIGNSGKGDLVFQRNTLSNAHANSLGGSINAEASGTGDLTYLVHDNTINGAKGTAIFVGKQFGGAPGDGTAVGRITSNRVGTAGTASSGSLSGSGIEASTLGRGKHSVVISGNDVRQYRDNGISLYIGGSPTSTTLLPAHDAVVNFTVTGNTVGSPGPNGEFPGGGVFLNAGTNSPDSYQVCLDMVNNQLAGSQPLGAASQDVWLRQRFNSVVRLPGYTGAEHNGSGTLASDLKAYLIARGNVINTLNASTQDNNPDGGGFFNTAGGAACPTN